MTVSEDVLRVIGQIDPDYRHHERRIEAGDPEVTETSFIKWYRVFVEDDPVPEDFETDARVHVREVLAANEVPVQHGFGFVVLHHSTVLDYVILCTWYQTQELWLRVWVRNAGEAGAFRAVSPGEDWSSFCVWELAPIWYERGAWNRYLYSARDEVARLTYIGDTYSGSTGDL